MTTTTKEMTALQAALEQGANVSIQFTAKNFEDAKDMIEPYCKGLGRTYEELEDDAGEYKWLAIVKHNKDVLDLTVFYQAPDIY